MEAETSPQGREPRIVGSRVVEAAAIRLAVGGTRSRIVRQLLVQGLLLSLAGGALGLWTATWAAQLLVSSMATVFPIFLALDLTPDTTVLVATMIFCSLATVALDYGRRGAATGILAISSLAASIIPARRAANVLPMTALRND